MVMGAVLSMREYGRPGGEGLPASGQQGAVDGQGPQPADPGGQDVFLRGHHETRGSTARTCAKQLRRCPRSGKRSLDARSERSERPVAGPARRRTLTSREDPPDRHGFCRPPVADGYWQNPRPKQTAENRLHPEAAKWTRLCHSYLVALALCYRAGPVTI